MFPSLLGFTWTRPSPAKRVLLTNSHRPHLPSLQIHLAKADHPDRVQSAAGLPTARDGFFNTLMCLLVPFQVKVEMRQVRGISR
jgi:hypothetical protein